MWDLFLVCSEVACNVCELVDELCVKQEREQLRQHALKAQATKGQCNGANTA